MQKQPADTIAPASKASTIPSDFDELESLSSQTEDVLTHLNNEAKDHASCPVLGICGGKADSHPFLIGRVQLVSQLVQLSRVLRIIGDSLISYANIINSYEDVSLIPKEALWTPPTFNTSQDLAPILLGFPPVVQDTPLFYPLTNVNLLQIARFQHQAQESVAKKILTRPIKKAPLRKMKSSSSDIAMGSTSSSALKNELHPEDEEMNEIWDSFDVSMEDLNQIDEAMAEPFTSTGLSSNEDVIFSINTIIKNEESGPEEKDQRDEEMQRSKSDTVFTHVDLKKFICPTSLGKTIIKPEKVNKQRSFDAKGSSSSSGYYKPTNDSTDEQQ